METQTLDDFLKKKQINLGQSVKKISHITFSLDSPQNIQQQAHVPIKFHHLYNNNGPQRTYQKNGLLDRKMGTSDKITPCDTCGKTLEKCVGHFGYIDLPMPVFHVGFYRAIITILQTICKECSHILLKDDEKQRLRRKMLHPSISYIAKKALRSQIATKAKKTTKCSNCNALNGMVKKQPGTDFMKIIHDKYRSKKATDPLISSALEEMLEALQNKNITNPSASMLIEDLHPLIVLNLFKRIPESEICLLGMNSTLSKPSDMILTRLPVPPITIRPSIVSNFRAGTTEDGLTSRQSEILLLCNKLSTSLMNGDKPDTINEYWEALQVYCGVYINSETTVPLRLEPQSKHNGIVQRLKGKQGRFRGNLSGKRVDFTSRTVISPDPNLEIHEVGVPVHVAKTLTYPEKVTVANLELMKQLIKNGPNIHPGANYVTARIEGKGDKRRIYLGYGDRLKVAQKLSVGDLVERHMYNGDIVLFNRQPSLHRLSIMCHNVKVHQDRTFKMSENNCTPYNADFDGDEMNLHFPQTEEARAEAMTLMANKHNLVTPRNGELLIAATQDFITGGYLLTQRDEFFTRERAMQLLTCLLVGSDSAMHIDMPEPAILKPRRMWTGKQIFSLLLRPNKKCPVLANLTTKGRNYTNNKDMCIKDSYVVIRNSELLCGSMDKGTLGSGTKSCIFYILLRDWGEEYAIKTMWRLARVSSYFLMNRGFSFGISDVTPGARLIEQKNELLEAGYKKCDDYIQEMNNGILQSQPGCTPEETLEAVMLKELSSIRELAAKACFKELHPTNAPLIMAQSGSKGSNINISQMIACVGQQAINGKRVGNGFEDRALPHFEKFSKIPAARGFVKNSFFTGLTPPEFFFHTMAGREGLVDTAVKTAETGYLQRRLVKCLEDLVVHYDNTVRNANKEVVEFTYGGDALDPTYMEGKDKPVDLDRVLEDIKAKFGCREESPLLGEEVLKVVETTLAGPDYSCCSEVFKTDILTFVKEVGNKVMTVQSRYGINLPVFQELERITHTQLLKFLVTCREKYMRAKIEPGTAVGAIAAQSIGEPGTQMTLKTFHFAGVASMNITQGVPRIMEIINASKSISTPIITAKLEKENDMEFARQVKGRIEKTTLGEISSRIEEVYLPRECFLLIQLDIDRIRLLKLELDVETIKYSLCTSKIKLKPVHVVVVGPSLIKIHPDKTKHGQALNVELQRLLLVVPKVVVVGLPSVSRAVMAVDDANGVSKYKLCIEGNGLRDVMATAGVVGKKTVSNNIWEVYSTLGIEAAKTAIMHEIREVMEGHGMSVDSRHMMLLASQMTSTGELLGITRYGLAKMKNSVLNLASFEKTADHLFDASLYGQKDAINGVSESIIMGIQAPIGTGIFQLIHDNGNNGVYDKKPTFFHTALNS